MKGKSYDIDKLAESGMFDIGVATRFYYNTQEYFDALTNFMVNHNRPLSNYTPAFVVNSEPDREQFMKECFEIRADFVRLGLTVLLDWLVVMENAAIAKNAKEFMDGQINFHASLKICRDTLRESTKPWRMTLG